MAVGSSILGYLGLSSRESKVCREQFPQLWSGFADHVADVGFTGHACASPQQVRGKVWQSGVGVPAQPAASKRQHSSRCSGPVRVYAGWGRRAHSIRAPCGPLTPGSHW